MADAAAGAATQNLGMFQSAAPEDEDARKARVARCPVTAMSEAFRPFAPEYISDPYKFFAHARDREPVFWSPEMDCWVVMKFDDIVGVFQDPETFSARLARHPVTPICPAAAQVRDELKIGIEPSLVDEGPETHRKHRKIFGDAFTPRRVNELEPRIREITTRYIDRFIAKGRAEIVGEMLYELPALVIFLFLGAPDDDALMVKQLGSTRAVVNWGRPSEAEQIAMMRDMAHHWDFTVRLVDAAFENPGDNYLGDLVRMHRNDPSLFTKNYLCNVMFLMQFAGHETTTQASANGLKMLLENRDQWDALCADPMLVANAVEEILRMDSSIFAWRRLATRDVVIHGQEIKAGDKILVMLGSGNRDDAMFPDGERFDATRRNARRNLAFGHGAHFCMGAPLARLEMKVIFEELTKRLPNMRLVPGQNFRYIPTLTFRGVQNLQVEWD
ncbi:MAG: cytochrome P450 [Beijerinckiaceae bacterium]